MGSMITLGLGKLEIDWGKNNFFRNHSKLFEQTDVKNISYYYADNEIDQQEGYSKKLKFVKLRLELLGYTLDTLEKIFNDYLQEAEEHEQAPKITFNRLIEIIKSLNIDNIDFDEEHNPYDYDFGEFVKKYLFEQNEFKSIFSGDELSDCNLANFLENIDPYFLLRVLSENQNNLELNLEWRYADVVDNGWVSKEEIQQGLQNSDKYLIVTEGSSDSFIIKKAIEILYPEIKDFFYFIDMHEHYPFTGTGNLYKFSQGLASINIQNNVILIYDNDVAGIEKFNKTSEITLPKNMKVMHLPYHDDFKNFNTIGPNGKSLEDINGKAVAIELFLDLDYKEKKEHCVRWTTYNKEFNMYQGELIHKETYIRKFKTISELDNEYKFDKLKFLIDKIIDVSKSIHT